MAKVVCKGDSGGGLLIPQMIDSDKRYHLEGVVSNSPRTLDCATDFYSVFTNVQYYKIFIMGVVKEVNKVNKV